MNSLLDHECFALTLSIKHSANMEWAVVPGLKVKYPPERIARDAYLNGANLTLLDDVDVASGAAAPDRPRIGMD